MKNNVIAGALIALGLCLGGCFIYLGISKFANKDRAVSVKGLSTREVEADYAVWPLSYAVSGNDLPALYAQLEQVTARVKKLLMDLGFEEKDIRQGSISVTNNWASYYGARPEFKYTLNTSLIVSTDKVQLVVASQGKESSLLKEGIIVTSNSWNLDYQFNGLPELKPAMIEEATQNARAVAQKFADDAQCSLGSIRRASQGQFSIESDEYQPWVKRVRVVTTVDYFLD
ncbi:MAG: SIMPL domain-containing protein [Paludibacteraceae bacterium]|nr:SIMPL domain-containing protein [Paludibacteraceae bacterium]MBQ2521052.1 SIMPL domain-containing protein [Paludibacteraceae bacterium]MBQ4018278.1 SIMPL domain-containing protein [Paludibacteraceae bacterium]MBQ5379185.1 SIMPL domain-containing protein [Paludibacteraceae bacterium]